MSTPESKVKKKVKSILDSVGAYHFSPGTHGYGASGVPDIIVCYRGRFIGIECKAGDNKPTPLQEKNIWRIGEAGGDALVVNETNTGDVLKLIEAIRRAR